MSNALLEAEKLGMATVQVFTKNQQQWKARPLSEADIALWREHSERLKFERTVCHDSYLINVGSPDQTMWRKSLDALIEEHERCAQLGIPYLVMHPGAHVGSGEDSAIQRIAQALNQVHDRAGKVPLTCLEITAGQGTNIGYRLEHLAAIIDKLKRPERAGICLDTAHLFAAGYDIRGKGYAALLKQISQTVGMDLIKVWHLNDSKKELGSRVDRHDHIGEGRIGLDGFRDLVNDEAWKAVPKILETPKEKAPDGRDWDLINLQRLKDLMRK